MSFDLLEQYTSYAVPNVLLTLLTCRDALVAAQANLIAAHAQKRDVCERAYRSWPWKRKGEPYQPALLMQKIAAPTVSDAKREILSRWFLEAQQGHESLQQPQERLQRLEQDIRAYTTMLAFVQSLQRVPMENLFFERDGDFDKMMRAAKTLASSPDIPNVAPAPPRELRELAFDVQNIRAQFFEIHNLAELKRDILRSANVSLLPLQGLKPRPDGTVLH